MKEVVMDEDGVGWRGWRIAAVGVAALAALSVVVVGSLASGGNVRISRYEMMSDMHWSTSVSAATGRVGDVITMTKTARNDGSHTQSYVEYQGAPTGMTLESAQGCTVTVRGCRIDNIAVGATAVTQLRYRIVDCSGNGYRIGVPYEHGTNDPVNFDVVRSRDYVLKMTGC